MKILSVIQKQYYGLTNAIEPMYYYFVDALRDLGHQVEHFDHYKMREQWGVVGCGEKFVETVKKGNYQVVFYQTSCPNAMPNEAIGEAKNYCTLVGWNTDDDWQWESYTRHLAQYFTFIVTTYPHIYETHKKDYPNLKLSQWGCYERLAILDCPKDLDFTFAGQFYGDRIKECWFLKRSADLKVFGLGSGQVNSVLYQIPILKKIANKLGQKVPFLFGKALLFPEINKIWSRSKISYTPMGASVDSNLLQIKSRTFEMGLSKTLMLCQHSPNLEKYYEPYKEFIPFENLEDCADKAKYYLKNESERLKIVNAYYERTKSEHLWKHRFERLFQDIGF